jgi:glycosyltransferase involved in cell wall biosynthesis
LFFMLDVLIDATPVTDTPSGVGFYVLNLVQALAQLQAEESFSLNIAYQPRFASWLRRQTTLPQSLQQLQLPVRLWNLPVRLSSLWAEQHDGIAKRPLWDYSLRQSLGSPTIVHGTNYSVYPCPGSRRVMTIYDLTCIRYPNYVDQVARHYADQIRHHLRWTDLVITISENSKRDIVELLGVSPDRVWVTPLARSHSAVMPQISMELIQRTTGYDLHQPFLLFVSTIEPRKNILGLIRAFEELRSHYRIPHNLVLVGRRGWCYEPVFEAISQSPWRKYIYHLDYLSDADLATFYSKADAFVYPSHYEGFGLPILEAMAFGVPVVTSNTSSLPEVAGDAALYASPHDTSEIAAQVFNVLTDTNLRDRLAVGGKVRAQHFSWEATARQSIAAYRSIS